MTYPNNYFDGTLIGVVVGGDINDPAPDQSCNMKVFLPGLHGKDVKVDHLAFSTMMKSPTKGSQSTFEGTLDPGSMVFVRKDTGSNQCHIIGTANEIYNPDARTPGNIDLLHSIPFIADIMKRTIDINIPPQVMETVVGGAKVKMIKEKGQQHSHSLLAGIPANGAIYTLSGLILPQITNVTTAVQAATSVLDDALASALPGTSFSLGNLLNSLSGGLLDQLTQALPKNLMKSFTNMTTLMQSIEASTGGSFSLAAKCDPEVFLTNAVGLLSQATNLSDLISAMQQLQTDTSLYGLENLGNTVVDVQTAFGKVKQSVDAFGNIIGYIPPDVASAAQTFTSALTSATSFPGVNIGQNLFGQSAAIIGDMINRLPPDNMKNAVSMLDKLNTSGDAKKIFNFVKATVEGDGNPFNFFT